MAPTPARLGLLTAAALLGAAPLGAVPRGPSGTLQGAPLTPEQQKTLQDIALAKARTELLDRVRELPLRQSVSLGDWLKRDAALERRLHIWVRARPAAGDPRLYSDGVCEADARIDPAALQQELLDAVEDYPDVAAAAGVNADSLKSAAARWPVLWATGSATLTKQVWAGQPPGWENVTREGVELARGAASADAYHALLAEAGLLKVTHARRLREFLDSGEVVRKAVEDEIRRVATLNVEFAPDQVAVAEARLAMRDLLRILTRVQQDQYRGGDFTAADFREMSLLAGRDELKGTGLAAPPSRAVLRTSYAPIEYDAPDWVSTTLTAAGRYEPADADASDSAARGDAARLDGLDRLRARVEQLIIQKNVTVADFLAYHQDLKDDVTLFLSATHITRAPKANPGGGVEVEVALPLRRLWEILRRKMQLEEVEPPPAPRGRAADDRAPPSSAPATTAAPPADQRESP